MGAPLGYVGCEEGGALAEAVRRSRYQVVTFGEVEKAHPDVFSVLLQVLDGRKIVLELDDKARTWLADKGYDPIYGARPLKRVIQKNVQDPLAELILEGSVRDGDPVPVSANDAGPIINGQGVNSVAAAA